VIVKNPTQKLSPPLLQTGGKIKRITIVLTATFLSLILATLISTGWLLYQAGIKDWTTDLTSLGSALSESVAQSISSAHLVLDSMQADIENLSIKNANQLHEQLATKQYSHMLKERIQSLPFISGVGISGGDGKVVVLSRVFPSPSIDMSDRDYFDHHVRFNSTDDFLGKTIKARSNDQPTFFLTRRVNDKNGHLLAILVVGLRCSFFEDFFKSIANTKPYSVLLARNDNQQLVSTGISSKIQAAQNSEYFSDFQREVYSEADTKPLAFKENGWLGVRQRVRNAGLYLEIAVTNHVYLDEWLISMSPVMAVAAITLIALVSGFIFIIRLAQQRENDAVTASKLKAEADLANDVKSQFLAFVSHEIRTPMNGVLGLSEVLSNSNIPEQPRQYAQSIYSAAKSLVKILNDVLDLSKMESGQIEFENISFQPAEIVLEVTKLFRPMIEKKGLQLETSIETAPGQSLLGDPSRIQQVLTNLISNAVKFTSKGRIKVSVTTEEVGNNKCVLTLSVLDSGVGIAANALSKLFQPFSQANNSISRQFGGTGLGLAISKNLVEKMGGSIKCVSAENRFTEFRVSLTLEKNSQAEENTSEGSQNERNTSTEQMDQKTEINFLGRKFLVVDDTFINRQLLRILLDGKGCAVTYTENGEQALEEIYLSDYDLILMDCMMPIKDGYETTLEIRRYEIENSKKRTPIIALTASALEEDRQRCLAVGMDDYLTKPFTQLNLFSCLKKWIPPLPESPS
jgi:signal transduction histidine kinase/ActR/RegA family two-component response regulator